MTISALSKAPRAQLKSCLLLLTALAVTLSACTTPTLVSMTALDCRKLIHPTLRQPVPSAKGPADATQGEWVGFAVAQTGQLEKANVDKQVILNITDECYEQQALALKAAQKKTRPWWKIF